MKTISIFACALVFAACDGSDGEHARGQQSGLDTGMPCAVQSILDRYCSTCHGDTPTGGAPLSLSTQSAFHGTALTGEPVYTRALAKLSDPSNPMPPVARDQLTAAEKKTLTDWLAAKAPASQEACETSASADAGAALPPTIPDSECEVIFELRAHGGQTQDDKTGYQPPDIADHYECFHFSVPWLEKMQILKLEPLIGDRRVLHHYLLYQDPAHTAADGSHEACNGSHPSAALLAGWAPGGQAVSLPTDVGLQVASGPDAQFNLELHYNNQGHFTDVADNSGVRVCATSKLRKNEASSHWLGSELIVLPPGQRTDVVSDCNPKQTAHIISVSPHMHKAGRHLKTIITRADGSVEPLFDRAFDFNDQQICPVGGAAGEVIVGPGDRLTTTCSYENDTSRYITFGQGTAQEMCYNFVVAWPAGSLATGGGLLSGPNRCQQ